MPHMGLYSLSADHQPLSNLLIGETINNQSENFHFSVRKRNSWCLCRCCRLLIDIDFDHSFGNNRVKPDTTAVYSSNGSDKLL